jgi:hypothetical protein
MRLCCCARERKSASRERSANTLLTTLTAHFQCDPRGRGNVAICTYPFECAGITDLTGAVRSDENGLKPMPRCKLM